MKSLYPRKPIDAKKCCAICEKQKSLKHFPVTKRIDNTAVLYHSYCKPCLNQYMLDRYHYLKDTK